MSKDVEEHCRKLAGYLRSMLDDKLGTGSNLKRNPKARPIVHLFGITYASDLDGLDEAELAFIAAQSGLPFRTYTRLIQDGRDLAEYVEVKEIDKFQEEVREFMQEVRRRLPT